MKHRIIQLWSQTTETLRTRGRWFGYALTTVGVLYLAGVLILSGFNRPIINWQDYFFVALYALLLYPFSLLLQFFIWFRLFSYHHSPGWRDVEIYARMLLVRRLPGGPWHWLGRTSMYTAMTKVPTETVLYANLMEWGLLILVAGGLAEFVLIEASLGIRLILLALITSCAIILAALWQPAERAWWRRLPEAIIWVFFYAISWSLGGIILHLLARTTGSAPLSLLTAIGLWSLTGAVSLVVTTLPVFGVQEVSLVILLQPYMPVSAALLSAFFLRLLYTFSDIVWGLTGWGLATIGLKNGSRPQRRKTNPKKKLIE